MNAITLTEDDLLGLPSWELFADPPPRNPEHARRFYNLGNQSPDYWPQFVLPEGWECVGIFAHGDEFLAHIVPQPMPGTPKG